MLFFIQQHLDISKPFRPHFGCSFFQNPKNQFCLSFYKSTVTSIKFNQINFSFVEIINHPIISPNKSTASNTKIMDLHIKTKDELINELQKLQQENIALKANYEKCINEQKLMEKAKEKKLLKSEFIVSMSHEIRTPLNAIQGFSFIQQEDNLEINDLKKYAKILNQMSTRLRKTIDDFFEVLFIDYCRKANISVTNITEIIEGVYSALKPEIETKGILFSKKNTSLTQAVIVKTDRFLIQQILTKLIMSFLKFTNDGTIEMGFAQKMVSDTPEIEFYIKNTGITIPQNKHQSIFNLSGLYGVFETKDFEGLGSDLFVANSYVEMLGGTIRLESEEGKGTTVYFTVPDITPN
jgi:signal transduction histidine kinase